MLYYQRWQVGFWKMALYLLHMHTDDELKYHQYCSVCMHSFIAYTPY